MKKTFSLVVALCCCAMMMAQSSYRVLVEELQMLMNGEHVKEMAVDSYSKLAVQKGVAADAAKAAAENYYDKTMWPTTIDMTVEAYKGKVSEGDLKQLIKAYRTPVGKTAMAHSLKCSSPENQQKLQSVMMPGVQAIIMGEAAQAVQAPECTDVYKKKFSKYFKLANMSTTFDSIFSSLKTAFQGQMSNEAADAMVAKVFNFFSENAENIMLHACVDALTESDLDFFDKTLDTEAGLHVTSANKEMSKQMAAYGVQSVSDFLNSLGQ